MDTKPHPAKYTDALMPVMAGMLSTARRVLDPFGGTGKIFALDIPAEIHAIELEPEWAQCDKRMTVGNALHLPYAPATFDAVCTSPTYGNRMADRLLDGYERITYTAKLGRKLSADNSGGMQWGDEYRRFHVQAWTEARRVLAPGGVFVLNIKNHIRGGVEMLVTEWHIDALQSLGFVMLEHVKVATPSMRFGQNGGARVGYESVIKFSA